MLNFFIYFCGQIYELDLLLIIKRNTMKKNRNTKSFKALLLVALGIGILSACCAPGVRKTPNAAQVEDTSAVQEDTSAVQEGKTLKKEDISNENVMIDTVYGDWHVRVDTVGSKTKVKNSDEFVQKLVVTISKGGKVLFDKKVFTREDIWKGADEELQVYAALPLTLLTLLSICQFLSVIRKRMKVLPSCWHCLKMEAVRFILLLWGGKSQIE